MLFWPFAESLALAGAPEEAGAQLNECALIDPLDRAIDVPGGCIAEVVGACRSGPAKATSTRRARPRT